MSEDFVFGTRAVIEAIRSGRTIDKVMVKKGLSNELFQELYQLVKEHRIPFQFVPVEKINRITRKNHQGVVALLASIDFYHMEDLLASIFERGETPLLILLDGVTDVRNFGAIVRSAECAGVHGVVIPEKGAARINADAVKTSAGALNIVPVCRTHSLGGALTYLRNSGVRIVAATEKAEKNYTSVDMTGPLAILMGAEDQGISPALLQAADELAAIPVRGKIESLNVSVAASLLMYEAVRQRPAPQG